MTDTTYNPVYTGGQGSSPTLTLAPRQPAVTMTTRLTSAFATTPTFAEVRRGLTDVFDRQVDETGKTFQETLAEQDQKPYTLVTSRKRNK